MRADKSKIAAALRSAMGLAEAAKALGVSKTTLKAWCDGDFYLTGLHFDCRRRGYKVGFGKRMRAKRARPSSTEGGTK